MTGKCSLRNLLCVSVCVCYANVYIMLCIDNSDTSKNVVRRKLMHNFVLCMKDVLHSVLVVVAVCDVAG